MDFVNASIWFLQKAWPYIVIFLVVSALSPYIWKVLYLLGAFYSLIDSVFNLFTYFWVDCALIGKLSLSFLYLFALFIFVFIYQKLAK